MLRIDQVLNKAQNFDEKKGSFNCWILIPLANLHKWNSKDTTNLQSCYNILSYIVWDSKYFLYFYNLSSVRISCQVFCLKQI